MYKPNYRSPHMFRLKTNLSLTNNNASGPLTGHLLVVGEADLQCLNARVSPKMVAENAVK